MTHRPDFPTVRLRTRVRVALAVLRGEGVAYRVRLNGPVEVTGPQGRTWVVGCIITGQPAPVHAPRYPWSLS